MVDQSFIQYIPNIETFNNQLLHNPGIIIIKFGENLHDPHIRINKIIYNNMNQLPKTVQNMILNVEGSAELYTFFKNTKMVKGLPALLCFYKGNYTHIPDDGASSTNIIQITSLFNRCYQELTKN